MTDETRAQGSTLCDAAFAASLAGEPPLRLDLSALERTAARRLRRRRTYTVSGVAAAVATLTIGATLGAPRVADLLRPAAPPPVPGCTTVLRTTDPAYLSWRFGTDTSGWPSTEPDNGGHDGNGDHGEVTSAPMSTSPPDTGTAGEADPAPSWFTAARAAAMSAALRDALPAGATLEPYRGGGKQGIDTEPLPYSSHDFPGGTAVLRLGASSGLLSIASQYLDLGVPPCTEDLMLRYTAPDGTVADVYAVPDPDHDRTLVARSFRADGTWVSVELRAVEPGPDAGSLPLTAQQLAEIATAPGLSITG